MLFYKIPMFEEQEPNVIELPIPKNLKEKVTVDIFGVFYYSIIVY